MDTKKYIEKNLENLMFAKNNSKKRLKKNSIALIGLGPHAKRIYLNYFKKHRINVALLVDLESKRDEIRNYLDNNNLKNTKIFTLPDNVKDNEHLPDNIASNLLAVCNTMEITHIIIATEPKAHNMYIEFALKNNIDVLTDKPITVCKNMTSINSIKNVRSQYYNILKLSKQTNSMCKVMCQRQYHNVYEYIKKLLLVTVKKYQVPITYIDIYHCDGNWEMPHDMLKENHPYKYGYGKLFHSGYHFIDLLSDFIKINNELKGSKKIQKAELHNSCLTPNEELNIFNIEDYKRIFKNQIIPEYYELNKDPKFNKFGEKNYYASIDFKNNNNQLITHANLNLLHYGFSRRGWIQSKDYYKNNGRIRHESINIQVGALMNIQIHSYQSKEIKDRTNNYLLEEQVGGLEHFDIDIYRNSDLIGGKPFERIKLGDLYSGKEKKNILGYNELSREVYLTNFLKGKCDRGDIKDQSLAIEILYGCALGLHNYYLNKSQPINIDVRNEHTYKIDIEYLKKYSNNRALLEPKIAVKISDEINKEKYDLIVNVNYLIKKHYYEVYICINDEKNASGSLLRKEFNNKVFAYLYYLYLNRFIKRKSLFKIISIIEKNKEN